MTITALNKASSAWYIPDSEKESETPTRFMLRPLTPAEKESVLEYAGESFQVPPKNYNRVLQMGLKDWENFNDDQGRPVKCSLANHNRLPSDVRIDLANEILIRSSLSEEEAKNS